MKLKKVLMILGICLIVGVFFATASYADAWYYNYTIDTVGFNSNGAIVKITNGTTVVQKACDSSMQNEMLAVALTALSNGSTVHVHYDSGTNRFDNITTED